MSSEGDQIKWQIMLRIYQHINSGSSAMLNAKTLAPELGHSVEEVDAWLRSYAREDLLRLLPSGSDLGPLSVDALTPQGTKWVESRL